MEGVAFSDIWYIYEILEIVSPQMEGINLSNPVRQKLKGKLIKEGFLSRIFFKVPPLHDPKMSLSVLTSYPNGKNRLATDDRVWFAYHSES
jgi:hypothetical protein